jgi:Ca2+-binding RTX toxin-like protein
MTAYDVDTKRPPDEAKPITDDMFHANIVATKNTLVPGGSFDTALGDLGVTGVRYAGGTVTEQYLDPMSKLWDDVFGPANTQYVAMPNGDYFMGPAPVIDYATANNLDFTLVVPTSSLVTTNARGQEVVDQKALAEVDQMVADMLRGKYGDVDIDQIEIGNEYQAYPNMTAETYGMVVNEVVLSLEDVFADYAKSGDAPPGWEEPELGIQIGPAWRDEDSEKIIDALEPQAVEQVASIIIHYYPENLDGVNDRGALFDHHEVWDEAHGHHHEVVVSEWNIATALHSDTGLAQASSLISAFDEMVREGVDEAEIWGVQFHYSQNALSTTSAYDHPDTDPDDVVTRLTAAGETFASLAESTIGLTPFNPQLDILMDRNGTTESIGPANDQADTIVNAFGDQDRSVVYFSSRTNEPVNISLNLNAYFGEITHVWGEVLTTVDDPSTPSIDEGKPLAVGGIPEFDTLTAQEIGNGSVITLDPYEILRINVQLDDSGVTMRGHDGNPDDPIDMDDTLIGSAYADSIHGFAGDDSLGGAAGGDVIHGGDGNDVIAGDVGADTLRGGPTADQIAGGGGDDALSGGSGSDRLTGDVDDDVIVGGLGDDDLDGGLGRDILRGGEGQNELHGGGGGDYYVIDAGSHNVIDDWMPGDGDKITFLGEFSSFDDLMSHSRTTAGSHGQPGNLVIDGPSGSRTVLVGAADQTHSLETQVMDFRPEGEAALDLSDDLNGRDAATIDRYIGAMSQGEFNHKVLDADPVILFGTLAPDAAGNFLAALDEDQSRALMQGGGDDAFSLFFESLDNAGVTGFVNAIDPDGVEASLDQLGLDSMTARAEDASHETASTFERKVQQTSYREDDRDPPDRPEPDNEPDPDDPDSQDGSSDGSGCFVATAVYGDRNHPDVRRLRHFRDTVLVRYAAGRVFIALYRRLGPHAARVVSPRPRLKALTRAAIARLVAALSTDSTVGLHSMLQYGGSGRRLAEEAEWAVVTAT